MRPTIQILAAAVSAVGSHVGSTVCTLAVAIVTDADLLTVAHLVLALP